MFFIEHIILINKYLLNEVMDDYESGPAFSVEARTLIRLPNSQYRMLTMLPSYLFSCYVVLPSILNRKCQHSMPLLETTTSNCSQKHLRQIALGENNIPFPLHALNYL